MTGDAAASCRSFFVVRMLFDGSRPWPVQGKRTVAIEAQFIRWLAQLGVVLRTVHIVAARAIHPAPVHHTLHKIISLHTVLVGCAVGVVRECCLAQRMLFELPKILQL